jgi:predicted transposase/invertase (TIGR01784 family)
MAQDALINISQDDDFRAWQISRQKYLTDTENARIVSEKKGFAKGKAEGKAEGLTEGLAKTALAMLQRGYPIEDVMSITNLSRTDIEKLAIN